MARILKLPSRRDAASSTSKDKRSTSAENVATAASASPVQSGEPVHAETDGVATKRSGILRNDASHQAARDTTGLVDFNLDDIASMASRQLLQCRHEVESLLQQAHRDAETIRETARREGYEQGLVDAKKDYEKDVAKASDLKSAESVRMLSDASQQLHRAVETFMTSVAEHLNRTIVAAVEKVVGKELSDEPEMLSRWIRSGLGSIRNAQKLQVAVHPETLARLGSQLDRIVRHPDYPEQVEIVPDESLAITEASVRDVGGRVDVGLQTQLNRLAEILERSDSGLAGDANMTPEADK